MTKPSIVIYDAHAHLVSDDNERYPRNPVVWDISMLPKDGPYGPGVIGLPGGMHGANPNNVKPTAQQLHGWMKEENVVGITSVQKGLLYRTDNSYIVDASNLYPDDMSAVIIVDPMEEKTVPMIRELTKRGVVGIRFFPYGVGDKIKWLRSSQTLEVFELANELGIVVDIEAPDSGQELMIPFVTEMADRFPNMKIVLDHVFLPDVTKPDYGLDSHFKSLSQRENIYVKWTSLNMDVVLYKGFAPEDVLRSVIDMFGADKVMWGSDIGTSSGTYSEMISRAHDSMSKLNAEEKRKVFHDTGRRVFTQWSPTG